MAWHSGWGGSRGEALEIERRDGMSSYKPKALDADKMEKMFDDLDKYQYQKNNIEAARVVAYNDGYVKAIQDCRQSLYCSNYELSKAELA